MKRRSLRRPRASRQPYPHLFPSCHLRRSSRGSSHIRRRARSHPLASSSTSLRVWRRRTRSHRPWAIARAARAASRCITGLGFRVSSSTSTRGRCAPSPAPAPSFCRIPRDKKSPAPHPRSARTPRPILPPRQPRAADPPENHFQAAEPFEPGVRGAGPPGQVAHSGAQPGASALIPPAHPPRPRSPAAAPSAR